MIMQFLRGDNVIESIKSWVENIIIVVIISIIIEMILPDGSSKKYVKVVSGLYILYVIVNPILGIGDTINLNNIMNIISETETVETYSENDIADTYILSLQSSLKSQIEELGYDVIDVEIKINSDYSDISSINIKMKDTRL